MHKIILITILLFYTYFSFGQELRDQTRPDWVGIWGIWGGENYGGPEWPWYKGTMIHTTWKNIEPQKGKWDFSQLDENLKKAADKGLYIGIKVYQGDASPAWIYEHGVPMVKSSNNKTYPYYLDPDFKPLLFTAINKVAEHIKTLPEYIQDKIVIVQAPAGKSGDPQPYEGTVPAQYKINWTTGEEWREWNRAVFTEYARVYSDMGITLIIKPNEQLHEYFKETMPSLGRKTWSTAQGYQANNEMIYEWLRKDLVTYNGEHIIRGRGEFDHAVRENRQWFVEAPKWNMYWQCLWMLNSGLDIFNQRTQALDNPSDYIEAYTFFTDHAGYKSARDSKTAWCALRDGLDYLDTNRFPESIYGSAETSDNKARYVAIVNKMAPFGAHQGNPDFLATAMHNYYIEINALNDVAYNIWPGNYSNYLYQIDANETSQGYWRVGAKSQPYGRFARGFNNAEGKDTLYFDIDDDFFSDTLKPFEITVRIVYYDKGEGSWALKYHGADNTEQTAYTMTKTNTEQWKQKIICISDGLFSNGCRRGADIMLVNTDSHDDIFHMIEITEGSSPEYTINFKIKDGEYPIEGASVSFYGSTINTNSDGVASFTSIFTSVHIEYFVNAECYQSRSGTLDITGNMEYTVPLTFSEKPPCSGETLSYSVIFNVSDGYRPLHGAEIHFSDLVKTSNQSGIIQFDSIAPSAGMEYTVNYPGYSTITDTLEISGHIRIPVVLSRNTSRKIISSVIKVYPNPSREMLYIEGLKGLNTVYLNSLDGRLIHTFQSRQENENLNLSNLSCGLYIIGIKDNYGLLVYKGLIAKE